MTVGILIDRNYLLDWEDSVVNRVRLLSNKVVFIFADLGGEYRYEKSYKYNMLSRTATTLLDYKIKLGKNHLLNEIESIQVRFERRGRYSDYILETDLNKLQGIDMVIRFGLNIIRGSFLEYFPKGVFSFHHGDNRYFRGSPPGFWEVFSDAELSGVIIQRLTNVLDGGNVLGRASLKTRTTFESNQRQLLSVSSFLVDVIFNNDSKQDEVNYGVGLGPIFSSPSFKHILLLNLKSIFKWLASVTSSYQYSWKILIRKRGDFWRELKLGPDLAADPFLIRDALFFEKMKDFSKGKIFVMYIPSEEVRLVTGFQNELLHRSFPRVMRYNGQDYFYCEESELGEFWLYEINIAKGLVLPKKKILSYGLIDPIIVPLKDLFVLVYSKINFENQGLFYVVLDSKFDVIQSWRFLLLNPRWGRLAGCYNINNTESQIEMYTQNSLSSYGNELSRLTLEWNPNTLTLKVIESASMVGGFGFNDIHTYNVCGQMEVIDVRYAKIN